MNLKELVDTVSQDTSVPAGQVKKVTLAVLQKFAQLIDKKEGFRSSVVRFNVTTVEAREAADDRPARSQHNMARLVISPSNEAEESDS